MCMEEQKKQDLMVRQKEKMTIVDMKLLLLLIWRMWEECLCGQGKQFGEKIVGAFVGSVDQGPGWRC